MNQFLKTSTGGALLKDYYADSRPQSLLAEVLKRRRRNRAANRGMMPNDMDMIESSNMGYGLIR